MLHTIYFIYGLCVMFYFMMSWLFFHKDKELLSRLVAVLMLVIGVQCLKNLYFIKPINDPNEIRWMMTIASDVVAIPLYAFILIELCSPTSLTRRTIIVHELLFIAPFVLFILTKNVLFYYAEVFETFAYGLYFTIWGIIAIPRYNRELKQRFSYTKNINLNWLRAIFLSFVFILILWISNSIYADYIIEALYMSISLVVWMFISYYIYKHESVLDELYDSQYIDMQDDTATITKDNQIGKRIAILFEKEKVYLNPNLKVSDIAATIGTNRTYVWVVNYADHYLRFNSISALAPEDCGTATLSIDGSADEISYFTITGVRRVLSREIKLDFRTLVWDETAVQWTQVDTTNVLTSVKPQLVITAPLCNTTFHISGDRFLKFWNEEVEMGPRSIKRITVFW